MTTLLLQVLQHPAHWTLAPVFLMLSFKGFCQIYDIIQAVSDKSITDVETPPPPPQSVSGLHGVEQGFAKSACAAEPRGCGLARPRVGVASL